jgi:hypothetical protein
MARTRYYLRLPDPAKARGSEPSLSFRSDGAEGFAQELQDALRSDGLFRRWQALQDDPDEADEGLAAGDPQATVTGRQIDLVIELVVTTVLPGSVFKHRLRLLAGSHWQLVDVKSA